MNVLIVKLGATGDVVRTSSLLRRLNANVDWVTAAKNVVYLLGVTPGLRVLSWEEREKVRGNRYNLVINLEDTLDVAEFLAEFPTDRRFGAYLADNKQIKYTDDSRQWFDLSLISVHGRKEADRLKFLNRRTYQDMIFEGLGYKFASEGYMLPASVETGLKGDVAIAAEAGPVWPMKIWAYYRELQQKLEAEGLKVNVLPKRASLLEHLADVRNHRCLVGGDSLPMHLALGSGVKCVTIFNCTSPWEIHDYGIMTKIVSPLLGDYFYQRGFDVRATKAITLDEVHAATMHRLNQAA